MTELPNEDILWKLNHIRREGWCNMHSVDCVKDAAQQIGWDDLVGFIEEEVEIGSGHNYDGETWIAALQAAVKTHESGERQELEAGGSIMVPTSDRDDLLRTNDAGEN